MIITMSLFKMLKRNSRLALRGNWSRAILALIIFLAVAGVLSCVRQYALNIFESPEGRLMTAPSAGPSFAEIAILSFFTLLTVLLVLPLEMGVCRWFYCLVRGRPEPVAGIFVFFESLKNYGKSIWLYINILTRSVLWSFLFFAVPTAVAWLSRELVNGSLYLSGDARLNSAMGTIGVILCVILYILSAVLFVIFQNRYSLAIYILFDELDGGLPLVSSVRDKIKSSVKYSKGYRLSLLLFQLSFAGWAILCVLIIPLFFFIPYTVTSFSMYARYIIEKSRLIQSHAAQDAQESADGEQQYGYAANEDVYRGCADGSIEENVTVEEPTTRIPSNEDA